MISRVKIETTRDGVLLLVRVVPRASRTEVDGVHDGALRVRLKAPPVEGAANQELCRFIAKQLKITRRDVEISSGARSRTKTLLIRGAASEEVLATLLVE